MRHPRTAILMAHARGVIVLAAALRGAEVHGYAAARIKKTLTGSGKAPKEQMQHAVKTELGLDLLPEPNDVADACAVALCHYQIERNRRAVEGAERYPSYQVIESLATRGDRHLEKGSGVEPTPSLTTVWTSSAIFWTFDDDRPAAR